MLEVEEMQTDVALETIQLAIRVNGTQQLLAVFR